MAPASIYLRCRAMRSRARRGRRVTRATLAGAACAALVVHGTVLGTVHALGLSLVSQGFGHHDHAPRNADADLASSCHGDVLLAASARLTMCFAPWQADTDRCLDGAQTAMWIDLSACEVRDLSQIAAVSMLEPRSTERIKPIDP